jgi:hypothetical protein
VQTDLATWLLEQVAEDERAVAELQQPGSPELTTTLRPIHQAIWTVDVPVEAAKFRLAECDTKRRIIELHQPKTVTGTANGKPVVESRCASCADLYPCQTLRLLALPVADRGGYRADQWAPDGR